MHDQNDEFRIRAAVEADAEAIAACVKSAYGDYENRIGRPPGPVLQDYHQVIHEREVLVAVVGQEILGVLALAETAEGFLLDNVAVSPPAQGRGIGKKLLEYAEQRAQAEGYESIYLYTNELMVENQALYARIGYKAYDRRNEEGLSRVYMRKRFAGSGVVETQFIVRHTPPRFSE